MSESSGRAKPIRLRVSRATQALEGGASAEEATRTRGEARANGAALHASDSAGVFEIDLGAEEDDVIVVNRRAILDDSDDGVPGAEGRIGGMEGPESTSSDSDAEPSGGGGGGGPKTGRRLSRRADAPAAPALRSGLDGRGSAASKLAMLAMDKANHRLRAGEEGGGGPAASNEPPGSDVAAEEKARPRSRRAPTRRKRPASEDEAEAPSGDEEDDDLMDEAEPEGSGSDYEAEAGEGAEADDDDFIVSDDDGGGAAGAGRRGQRGAARRPEARRNGGAGGKLGSDAAPRRARGGGSGGTYGADGGGLISDLESGDEDDERFGVSYTLGEQDETFRDFSSMPLKADHEARPLWACPDGRIFLETDSPVYKPAYDFLIACAEPVSRPESIHEYALTPHSLYAAVSIGLDTATIVSVLDKLSKCPLPREVKAFIKASTQNYGKVKLVLQRNAFFVESKDPTVLRRLLRDRVVAEARAQPGGDTAPDGEAGRTAAAPAAAGGSTDPAALGFETRAAPRDHAADSLAAVGGIELSAPVRVGAGAVAGAGPPGAARAASPTSASSSDDEGGGQDGWGRDDRAARRGRAGPAPTTQADVQAALESVAASGLRGAPDAVPEPDAREVARRATYLLDAEPAGATGGGGAGGTLSAFEIRASAVERVKQRCLPGGLNYPMLEEYDFRGDATNPDLDLELKPHVKHRPFQEKSLAKMFGNGRARSGIIVLPCGAGKSLVGVSAAARVKKSTLVLCTNAVSVDQWAFQFQLWTGCPEERIARFTSDRHAWFEGPAGVCITTYTMVAYSGRRSAESERIMDEIASREWGLMVLDEVHVVPAAMFRRVLGLVKAHAKLGLTATLVREDHRIGDLNFLIGPKLYEANWLDLTRAGHIASVQCAEVWCPMPREFAREYHRPGIGAARRQLLYVMNPAKLRAAAFLVRYHEGRGDKVIVFSDNIYALREYAVRLRRPFIYGGTGHAERTRVLHAFKHNPNVNTVLLSKVGDNSLDIPEANVLIQVSSHAGSRRQEAQRLGRILRKKRSTRGTDRSADDALLDPDDADDVAAAAGRAVGGGSGAGAAAPDSSGAAAPAAAAASTAAPGDDFDAFFYTLVSTDTQEVYFTAKRQQFLVDQGYAYRVLPALLADAGAQDDQDLPLGTREEQLDVLASVLAASDADAAAERLPGEDDVDDLGFRARSANGPAGRRGRRGGQGGGVAPRSVAGSRNPASLTVLSGAAGVRYAEFNTSRGRGARQPPGKLAKLRRSGA